MKRVVSLLLILVLVTGCIPKAYTDGVSTRGYPDDIIPMDRSMVAYEYEEDDGEHTLLAGTEDDIEDVIEYYQEYFEDEGIYVEEDEGRKDYTAEGHYDGYDFEITIEEPSGDIEKKVFSTVISIVLEEKESTGSGPNTDAAMEVNDEDTVIEATQVISSQGGTITLEGNSDLAGTTVTIPVASVDREINFSIGTVEAEILNGPDTLSDTLLYIDVEEYRGFSQPMEITMKFADTEEEKDDVPVPVYVDDNGMLNALTIKSIDISEGTVTFYTYHASKFTYYTIPDLTDYPTSYDTGFKPSVDGFQERNQGSSLYTGGECYGMASFAKWYWFNHGGGLYSKFTDTNMGVSYDDNSDVITGQDIIATMAFQYTKDEKDILFLEEAQHSYMTELDEDGNPKYSMKNDYAAKMIIDSLYWGMPCEVGVYSGPVKKGGHSVLAYKYEQDPDEPQYYYIYIYDPNAPGRDDQYLTVDINTGAFIMGSYPAGTLDYRLTTTGWATFTIVDKYQNILDQAEAGFANTMIDLNITSHEDGDEVEEGKIYLTGTVDSYQVFGEQIAKYVDIINEDGDVFTAELTSHGTDPATFEMEVPLKHGENYLYFAPYYVDQYGYHNQLTTDMTDWFLINSTVAANVIYVTLTWDAQPDVDLYVTNPAGETAWYSNYSTSAGGYLDIDDTSSYGPEHFTLTTENTVYWDEGYEINVHYYNGEGPTSYTVTVIVNPDTPEAYSEVFYGYLSEDNSSNNSPGGSGPDWAYITTVYPREVFPDND